MRGKSVLVGNDLEMEEKVADLISRGYLLMNQSARRATLIRPRTARLLGVVIGLCGLLAVGCFFAASFTDSGDVGIVGVVFLIVVMPIAGALRFFYVHVRRDQVMHVLVRDQ